MLNMIAAFLSSGTFRRGAAFVGTSLAAMATPYVNQKLGLNVSDTVIAAQISALVVSGGNYVLQSMSNEKHARDAGAAAVAEVKTPDDVVNAIAAAPKP